MRFKKDQANVQALLDSGSKINTMTPTYAAKFDLKVRPTDVRAQKIDSSTFKTFEILLTNFQIDDKLSRSRFFQNTFLLTNTNLAMILGILFLILSNIDVFFTECNRPI